jgi:hypothetical protein
MRGVAELYEEKRIRPAGEYSEAYDVNRDTGNHSHSTYDVNKLIQIRSVMSTALKMRIGLLGYDATKFDKRFGSMCCLCLQGK